MPPEFNPYSKSGFCGNWGYVLCGPIPPSLIDARGEVIVDQTPATAANGPAPGTQQISTLTSPRSANPGQSQSNLSTVVALGDSFTSPDSAANQV